MTSLMTAIVAILTLAAVARASANDWCGPGMMATQSHSGSLMCVIPPPDADRA